MIDILYLAANRLEFTRETFAALIENTDWSLVRELTVYDDHSRDGTAEYLRSAIRHSSIRSQARLIEGTWGGVVAVMVDFLRRESPAPLFAKVDNDMMLPPGWLAACADVMERHPELDLLGIGAFCEVDPRTNITRTYQPARHIGGIGLFRRSAFSHSLPVPHGRYFGFTDWQIKSKGRIGWLKPALPAFLLDSVPHPPWSRYSRKYIDAKWQREWRFYPPEYELWHWRWPRDLRAVRAINDGHVSARMGEFFTAPSSVVAIDLISRGVAEKVARPSEPVEISADARLKHAGPLQLEALTS